MDPQDLWSRLRAGKCGKVWEDSMKSPLTESERAELLAELTEAHNVVSKVLSDLRSRYTVKSPTVKAAVKAERDLFHLKQELEKLELEEAPAPTPLPESSARREGR